MPTIIDALIVELGLDAKQLETKAPVSVAALKKLETQGDKTEKTVGKISKTSKETAKGFGDLSRTVTAFLSVIGGTVAIKAFIQDFVNVNAQLDRFAKNLGLSVSEISAWSNATEQLGGSAQGLQGSLDMLSKAQTQLMLTGESSLIPYLSALGISLASVDGKARPVTEILLDLSERFSHMDRTTANNMGRMMGIDQGTMNLLLQGRTELELQIRRQKEQNAVTKAQAEEASKLQKSIVGVKQSFAAFGRSLLMDAAPTIEKVLGLFQKFADWAQENKEFIADFLKVLAVGLGAIALAAMPINLTVLAVVALAAGIALLWQDYQVWKKGGDSLIDWGKWEPGIKAAIAGIDALAHSFENLIAKFDDWYKRKTGGRNWTQDLKDSFIDLLHGDVTGKAAKQRFATGDRRLSGQEIKDYFQKQGWSPAQAAGIASNLMAESSGNAQAPGDKGTAYGLAQWHKDRQAAFKAWSGHDIRKSTPEEQLAFVQFELTKGTEKAAGDALRNAVTAAQAGSIVSQGYERPKDALGEASRRGAYAQSLLGIPGASSVAASAPGGSAGAPVSIDRSSQVQIGEINIKTQATDAAGIARDTRQAFDYLFASQANNGLF